MPKISVHLEADSAEEFQALLAMFQTAVKHTAHALPVEEDPVFASDRARAEREAQETTVAPPVESAVTATVPVTVVPEEPVKTRKPRGPNKPKPVIETMPAAAASALAATAPVEAPVPAPEPQIQVASRQDLLDAFAEYVQRYGASFGYSDVSKLLQTTFGDGVRKASDVTDANIPVAIGAIRTALADNPYNRKRDYA